MAGLDWRRAKMLDKSAPNYKQERLDRAADNWLAHGSLSRPPQKKAKRKPTKQAPNRIPTTVGNGT